MNAAVVPTVHSLRRRLTLWAGAAFVVVGLLAVSISALVANSSVSVPAGSVLGQGPPVSATGTATANPLVIGSLVSLAALLVAGPLLGWVLSGRLLRPLSTLTEEARQISSTNLHRRLEIGAVDNELARLATTLNDLFARLDAAFASQRRFVANAAHELRTPIAAERMLLQVVLADPEADVEQLRAAAYEALAMGRRQEHLLDALLTLASSERGNDASRPRERVDLAASAGVAVAERTAATAARGLTITTDLSPAGVMGDPVLLESLVGNLVENAVRHALTGGSVRIRTCEDVGVAVPAGGRGSGPRDDEDRYAMLSVENDGPLIPSSDVDRLLEPFQRLGRDRVPDGVGGSGLGLAIVRAVVDAHGGRLTVQSRPEGGLKVTVTFPMPAARPRGEP
jgi:signal transduction histidine kinase